MSASELPTVEAEITFRTQAEGGRRPLADGMSTGNTYRPHIVIGSPSQRHAITVDGNRSAETYLGVAFASGPEHVRQGHPYRFQLTLMYWPAVGYAAVVSGATFTLREGASIVGHGRILQGVGASSTNGT